MTQPDPEELRRLGHEVVDLLADYLASVEDRALFPDIEPARLDELFDEPVPEEPMPAEDVLREVREKLLPNSTAVNHPGYLGLITSTPTPIGILGDFIASALNQNIGAYSIGPSGVAMELRTVRWLADLAGYDERAGGNLTSGGMMANFIGLKLARDWASGDRAQHDGVRDRFTVYTSEERHVSVDKAVDAIGCGRKQLQVLPTDDAFSLRLDALEAAIAEDKNAGRKPMCLVGIAGTTNTGAIGAVLVRDASRLKTSFDPLAELRAIADREHMWLHVDAAYGGGMLMSRKRPGIEALELADSITIDPHKWFYAPLDVGAVLVRDASRLKTSFGLEPPYLIDNRDTGNDRFQFYVHGFEQSRRLRALKVWMSLKRYGTKAVGEWVDANVAQAERLYSLAEAFEEKSFDESRYARMVADEVGTEHHELTVTSSMMLTLVPKLMDFLDEPFGDSSIVPTYFLSQFTREKVKSRSVVTAAMRCSPVTQRSQPTASLNITSAGFRFSCARASCRA